MSNSLDQDHLRSFVRPDLGPNCLQRLSSDEASRQRVELSIHEIFSLHGEIQML